MYLIRISFLGNYPASDYHKAGSRLCIIYIMEWLSCCKAGVTQRDGCKRHFYSVDEPLAPSLPSSDVIDEEDGSASCHAGIVGLRGGPPPSVEGRAGDTGVCVLSIPFEPPRDVSKSVFTDLSSCWSSAYEAAWASLTLSNIYGGWSV